MYESSGPDVKIRGTASHIAEKYLQLARDAQSSGDPVAAENYYQHAEHYFRLIAAAQEQLRQTQPYFQQQQGDGRGNFGDEAFDESMDEQPHLAGEPFAPREPQPFYAREPREAAAQSFQGREQPAGADEDDVERLPSFITGPQASQPQPQTPQQGQAPAATNGYEGQSDRFPLHRRRRRHRTTRETAGSGEGEAPAGSGSRNDSED